MILLWNRGAYVSRRKPNQRYVLFSKSARDNGEWYSHINHDFMMEEGTFHASFNRFDVIRTGVSWF